MEQRNVGTSGLRVSCLGLGTAEWGRGVDGDSAAAQITAFVEAGGTLIDSSPAYGDGRALRTLAELLDDVVPRSELVLSVGSGVAADGRPDCSRRTLLAQLDGALRELGTDHLDLWSVGAWDRYVPIDEVCSTIEVAVRSGRVRYAGVRGYSGWQLATACGASSSVAPIAVGARYSLLERDVETELVPAAAYHGAGVIALAPLAGGVLTGKYRGGVPADSRGADDSRSAGISRHLTDESAHIVDAVSTAADGLGTSPLAVALAWVRDRPGVAAVVVGSRDIGQLTGVLAADDVQLPAAIASALDDVSS